MIIVSSYGFRKPFVREKLQGIFENPEKKKVLLIPFAGYELSCAALSESRGLELFGFHKENIYVLKKDEPQKYFDVKFDLIYTSGGYPFKLLKEVQEGNLMPWLKKLIGDGVDYFGVSSGACLLCEDLYYLKQIGGNDEENYNLTDYRGMGVIKENILCHADYFDKEIVDSIANYNPDKNAIMVKNEDVLVIK